MNNEELKKYVENKIEENKEEINEIMLRYGKTNDLIATLAKRRLCEGSIKAYGDIIEKLSNDECNKKPTSEKKYYIKGKFYLKSGVVIEEVGKNIYDTEEEALRCIYDLQEEINQTVILGGQNISIDNVVIIYTELAAAQFEVVKE